MNASKRYTLSLFAVLLSLLSMAQKNVIDEVVWVVGDEAILRSDIEKRRLEYGSQLKGNPYCVIPEQLAIQKLFLHQAVIDSIEVTDADVNPYVEEKLNERIMMAGSKEKLEEYMKMPMVQIREELFDMIKNEMISMRMREQLTSDVKVTPAEVRRYFKDMPEDSLPLIPTQVEVQIIVLQPRIPQTEIERIKGMLRDYAERVNSGTTSFSTLARLYSEDPGSARQGGEMPYMGKGELDPGFANVAFGLTDTKKVSKIAQSEFGYHIIQLIDKRGDKVKCRHILKRPEVAQADIDSALVVLDSIKADILAGKISFEDAARYASDDKDTRNNRGILSNIRETGEVTTRFEMSELSTLSSELARTVESLEIGEISKPFTMINTKGKTVCAIARLKNRSLSHRASITEDFQAMKGVVEAKKGEEAILNWIKEKQKSTYIRINPDWRDCDFEYEGWVK
ncbi:MAG: peptidylprolyl isomerase [Bacteroidaceae bacterium]|nr:peptidylprolyl isomerase [Bacteroidaceae bacterium]MBQ8453997.1 peptidylprolyl isomerase [Bacteroidaceae bacterium]MBQ9169977.1 peptidylprolyl isomerase [Bacteroidaceae bacterium]